MPCSSGNGRYYTQLIDPPPAEPGSPAEPAARAEPAAPSGRAAPASHVPVSTR